MPGMQLVNTAQHTAVIRFTPDAPDTKSTEIVGLDGSTHFSFDLGILIKHWHGTALGVVITKIFVETEFEALPCCFHLFGLSLTWLILIGSRRFCGSSCCVKICLSYHGDWICCLCGCFDRSCIGFTDLAT